MHVARTVGTTAFVLLAAFLIEAAEPVALNIGSRRESFVDDF